MRIDQQLPAAGLFGLLNDYASFLRGTKRKSEAQKLEAELRARTEQFFQDNPSGQVVDVGTLLRERGH